MLNNVLKFSKYLRLGVLINEVLIKKKECIRFSCFQGPPRVFDGLDGVFYPAVSLNRNVTLTLTSGLEPPTTVEELVS